MNFQKNHIQKIPLILIIFALLFSSMFFSAPQITSALVDSLLNAVKPQLVTDPAHTSATVGKTVWDKLQVLAVASAKVTARMLAKKFIDNVTQATVSWIKGGMNGNPAYVSNIGKFLTGPGGVGDQAFGEFFADNGLNFLCEPFQLQVKLALQLGYGAGLKQKIGCTLSTIGRNFNTAVDTANVSLGGINVLSRNGSDFNSRGGWNAWLVNTIRPENTANGAYLIAKGELDASIVTASGEKLKLLDFGQGALTFTRCVDTYYDASGNPTGDKSPEYTDTPGSRPPYPFTREQIDQDGITSKQNCVVKTPGSTITGMLTEQSVTSIKQGTLSASLSDGIDAVLNALMTTVLNNLKKGVLDNNPADHAAYTSSLDEAWTGAMYNANTDLSSIYNEQATWNNTDWSNPTTTFPKITLPTLPTIKYGSTNWDWNSSFTSYVPAPYSPSTPWVFDPTSSLTPWNYNPGSSIATAWVYGPNSTSSPWTYNPVNPTAPYTNTEPWTYDPNSKLTPWDYNLSSPTNTPWIYGPSSTSSPWTYDAATKSWVYNAEKISTWNFNPGNSTAPYAVDAPWVFDVNSKLTPNDYSPTSPTNTPWVYGPSSASSPWSYNSTSKSWEYNAGFPTAWTYNPYSSSLWSYNSNTSNTWTYNVTAPTTGTVSGGGFDALGQAKNNANTLIRSLLKSELTYQNNYKIAQNMITQGRNVFASTSVCNMNYNRNDATLRSLLIRANVITNIDGVPSSERTLASIPWNLKILQLGLDKSNADILILNKAASAVTAASTISAVKDAMIQVNSTSFNIDVQAKTVSNIKTWFTGVQNIYNSLICPIDLTKVLQISTPASTSY